ncbi:MAG: RNA-binding S4 domain-containing protein [Pseudomonadota bacterium]
MTKSEADISGPRYKLRADKWLWHARFFKTRGLATDLITGGKLRLNGQHMRKASQGLKPGDVLTFPQGRVIRVIRVLALSKRRGPATEAQTLYEDISPNSEVRHNASSPGATGPRPTKKARRKLDQGRVSALE